VQYAFFFPSGVGLWVQKLLEKHSRLCIVASNEVEANEVKTSIEAFNPNCTVMVLPQWDTLPYAAISPSLSVQMQRKRIFERMSSEEPTIVITSLMAAIQKQVWDPKSETQMLIKAGGDISPDHLQKHLVESGFKRVETVYQTGDFCFRGGIVDIFLPHLEDPIRLDLFGNSIESIHYFSPESQRRYGEALPSIELNNPHEISLPQDIEKFKAKYVQRYGVEGRGVFFHAISQKTPTSGWEQLSPLFYDKLYSLFELFSNYHFFIPVRSVVENAIKHIQEAYDQRKMLWDTATEKDRLLPPIPPDDLYVTSYDQDILSHKNIHRYSPLKPKDGEDIGVRPVVVNTTLPLNIYLEEVLKNAQAKHQRVVVATNNANDLHHLQSLYTGHFGSSLLECDTWEQVYSSHALIVLWRSSIQHSFSTDALVVLSGVDLLGHRSTPSVKKKGKKTSKSTEDIISQATSLSVGDTVVHILHGIGRYLGLETIPVFNVFHDCVTLEYAQGDKLYLPVENIELLSRYGNEVSVVALDKLGGIAWQARQLKVKKQLRTIAKYLMGIAAKRLTHTAPIMGASSERYQEFCRGFPYVETDDQEKAISEVLGDLSKGTLMDRLICGDVGFGKTEVALRAAFAAAESGYQVGIIAPTTLLVRQHFHTFKKRFESFGYKVEQLSRLVTAKHTAEITKKIANGEVQILIGTHALLNKKLSFKNLGLLIVDEEQMFGVKQKEQIKELCTNVHVLTLSATPIPRTLQLSLVGIKEMSLIATPPVDRRSIQTIVGEEDPIVLHQAIRFEIDRGGQIFYVCPRISDLESVQKYLENHHPTLNISIAHGQMKPSELEDRLLDFVEGKTHILLSTQIIESGIDIPNVNTMIIQNSHLFGLAQLYQLRGRIGRSNRQAYAYLLLPSAGVLPPSATKRLQVMSTLDSLGAGFTLAAHDMDIRGAGNLLGEEQSGHIKEIGVELYQSMLKQAVQAIKKHRQEQDDTDEIWSPTLSLGLSVGIPGDYVEDMDVRMELYRRLGLVNSESQINEIIEEIQDRFGPTPDTVKNLITTIYIKLNCRIANLQKVETGPKGVVFTFRKNVCPYVEQLLARISSNPKYKIRADQKLFYAWEILSISERVEKVGKICKALAELASHESS
jgi:transcription-repair coupling factor (superfamily II helicase)